jgi:translation initiation factor 2 beta subunit (eIF-2beta)/eIF-5
LREREDDKKNYLDKPYRFIVELLPEHRFKEKEKVVKNLLAENKISREGAKTILSYYPSN